MQKKEKRIIELYQSHELQKQIVTTSSEIPHLTDTRGTS